MWHHTYDGTAWLAMAGTMTLMSLLTAVVVVAIVRAARNSRKDTAAVRVLDERYAGGELDADEFAERRRRLLDR